MVMPVIQVHSSGGGNNKGSSKALAYYLGKENQELKADEHYKRQDFFNHSTNRASTLTVIQSINNNKKGLGKNDAKYFAPTINFSKEELELLCKKVSDNQITEVNQLSKEQFKEYNSYIKDYSKKVMDCYAENFNRQDKGLNKGSDLVYFAKIEHTRKYKGFEEDVLSGKAKSGDLKQGNQSHVHFIVSRKDKTQRYKLSPLANEKNTNRKIGENNYKVGFDRKQFKINCEREFDKMFEYQRPFEQKFETLNTLKNGTPEEKKEIQNLIEKEQQSINPQNEIGR